MRFRFATLLTAIDYWGVVFGILVEPSAVIIYMGVVSVEISW